MLRVEIEIGEIGLVNVDQLTHLINMFAHDTIAKDRQTSVKEVKTKVRCRHCSYSGRVHHREVDTSWHYKAAIFDCGRCKSNQVVRVRELIPEPNTASQWARVGREARHE